ncbi:MAG: ABC transporter ATP-binding protein [Ruminococcaceae bacterium]|nr:ABC transporter ATP-binding protein [Oscillospiraceae bacterium]
MIRLTELSFSYGAEPYLTKLSLDLADGCLTAIVGENGSGKSTLLKLIAGELKPMGGTIAVGGVPTASLRRTDLAKRLSYFPQGRPTPDMTALEVAVLGRYPYTRGKLVTPKEDRILAQKALAEVGAADLADRAMQTLSLGERQKVYLAMLLAQGADHCLLDEPTNFLDPAARFSMMDALRQEADGGRCVVCVLHDLPLALSYADRLIVMRQGAVFADGTPSELCADNTIGKAFGVQVAAVEHEGKKAYLVLP